MSTQDHEEDSFQNFLAGESEMEQRTRDFDWGQTPAGPMATWPQGLKTAVRIMLGSRYAMWLGWGEEFTFLYNDAYAKMTLGPKHPWALGRSAREVWSEIWDDIGPRAESVIRSNKATWDEGLLLFLERQGFPEETYHTFSYSPLPDDSGGVGGMLCVVTEDTERTIGDRRLQTLRELAARTTDEARSVDESCQTATEILANNPHDLPFTLLYLLDSDGRRARLVGLTGVSRDLPTSPAVVDIHDQHSPWPFHRVVETGQSVKVENLTNLFGSLSVGIWPESPQQAIVLPLARPGKTQLAGFMVAGVSPRLSFEDAYRGFLDLAAGQITTAVANARAYEEERKRADALAELDRAKTAFFSNVSHEFRTPLTLMLGPVEDMLSRSYTELSPSAKGQLEVVNRNGLRLLRLVNSLLDFSRIEAGRVRAAYQPTDLAAFTTELASVFRAACERAGLALTVECASLDDAVFVDRDMWEKIVLNLLSNAFKFTYEGEISVTLKQVDNAAELCVRDTGTGIPSEEIPRLFERFHRVENARGRTHEGSGIGLALVHELVKLHSGSINVESVIGEGTAFTITVPLGASHLPADQIGETRSLASTGTGAIPYVEEALRWLPETVQADDQPELPDGQEPISVPAVASEPDQNDRRPRVLVADDNADMRQYVMRLLAEHYSVLAVADGEAALAAAQRHRPDLILSDVMMPRLDGFSLLKELRSDRRTKATPVIMLSARAGEESRVEGLEAGADDYLVKPFSARELLARVAAHLQMAQLRRESELAVRESEEHLRMALEAARMVAWQLDPSSGKLAVSSSANEVFGLLPGTTLQHSDDGFALLHPDDAQRHRKMIEQAVEECGSFVSRFRMIRPDNSEIVWLEDRGHGVADSFGDTERLIGVMIDITERKRTEEQLQKERDLLSITLASIGDAVITTDIEGRITSLNGVAESLTGWRNTEAAGQQLDTVFRIINEKTRQSVENPSRKALREDVTVGLANHTVLIAKDGTERPIDDSAAPIRGKQGQLLGSVLVFRDITQRRQAEAALRESADHFRSMADNAPTMLWVTDPLASCTYISKQWCEYTGTTVEQNMGIGWFECVYPEDRQRAEELFLNANAQQAPFSVDYRLKRHDGEYRWAVDSGLPRFDEQGNFQGYVGTVTDIHDRKQAEVKLREQEAQYRSIFESTSDAILIFDYDGCLIEVNPAACSMHGYAYDEFVGIHGTRVVDPDDHHKFADFVQQVAAGKEYHVEGTHLQKNGEPISILVAGKSFVFAGRPALLAVVRDISQERKATEALRKNEQRLRFIMDSMPQKIFTATPNGDVDYFNPIWMTFTGQSFETISDWGWAEIIHPDDVDENIRVWQQSIDTGEPFQFEHRFRRSDGQYRWHISRALPMRDEDGKIVMWIGSNTEIHETKSLQDELRQVATELSEADRRKTEFLATLGHELRNPLAPIRTGLELMKLLVDDPVQMEETRSMMERQAQQMVRLIDDLLDVSRITQGKLQLRTCRVALNDVVQNAVEAIQPFIDEAGHELTVSLPERPVHLEADPNRLAQLLSNLLNNSTKYTPEGGHIRLTAERQESEIIITVKDNGIGIPAEMQQGIFEMFNQIDRPFEEGYKGLGIGLTLVKQLAEMHGGKVAVHSEGEGEGSEFTVRLPIEIESQEENKTRATQEQTTAKPTQLRILVVDDNKAAADMLGMAVKMLGNDVRKASDGKESIEVAAEFRPDVILMDLGMPRMNGYDAARHIREQEWGKNIVLIALTGWGQEEDRQRTKEAGFDHHLVKPAAPAVLRNLLANVSGGRP